MLSLIIFLTVKYKLMLMLLDEYFDNYLNGWWWIALLFAM